jgi:hypothetical protein
MPDGIFSYSTGSWLKRELALRTEVSAVYFYTISIDIIHFAWVPIFLGLISAKQGNRLYRRAHLRGIFILYSLI